MVDGFNQQFIYSIFIIGLGYLLKRTQLLKESDGDAISRVIFNVTLPALIMTSFHDIVFEASLMILVVVAIVFGLLLAFIGITIFRNEPNKVKGMLVMMIPGYNIGLFAYPLVEGIWGADGIKYFGVFDIGNAFIVFGLAYLLGSFYSDDEFTLTFKDIAKKLSNSIPLMTYFVIFLFKIVNVAIPELVLDTASIVANANMPLSLLILGLYMNFNLDKAYIRLLAKFVSVRIGVGLIFGSLFYFFLPVEEMIRHTLLIGLILPIPLSAIPYAVEFDYDKKMVGMTSNITIVISFILIWLIGNLTF